MASCLDNSSLMKSEGTKTAATKASTIADQRKFDFLDGRNPAPLFVGRMKGTHIGKCINIIHLLCSKRHGGRILNHIYTVLIRLREDSACKRIRIFILNTEAFSIKSRVLLHFLIGRK